MSNQHEVKVAIIGGGPAGSAAAAALARAGTEALVIEQEQFPRFHVGESLLPNCNTYLKKIGVWEKVRDSGYVIKRGGQFMLPDKSVNVLNDFAHGIVKKMDMTFQVERAKFDQTLFEHAQACGAQAWQQSKVVELKEVADGWELKVLREGVQTTVKAEWLIDASGRKCVVGRQLKLKRESLPIPGRLAIFNHFRGIPRDAGDRGGDTLVVRLENAWVWLIPLAEGVTSVGVVLQSGDEDMKSLAVEEVFWQKIAQSSVLSELLANADVIGPYRTDSDYSYAYECYGDRRALLAGDASSFIDPVFSSGVCIALKSGILAAEKIAAALAGKQSEADIYAQYTEVLKQDMKEMRILIDMFYEPRGVELLMAPRPLFKIPQAVNSILAGVFKPGWRVRWRLWIFWQIYARHKKVGLVPKIDWMHVSRSPALAAKKSAAETV